MHSNGSSKLFGALVLLLVVLVAACAQDRAAVPVSPPPRTAKLDLQFVNHVQANLPEQDVFIERAGTPADKVVRVEGNDG